VPCLEEAAVVRAAVEGEDGGVHGKTEDGRRRTEDGGRRTEGIAGEMCGSAAGRDEPAVVVPDYRRMAAKGMS
jgi:hypothetical protein